MKNEELYRYLKELAEKLGIICFEKNFKIPGLNVKSGLCRVEGHLHFYMDKHLKIKEKTEIMAKTLSGFHIEDIYIVPAVREYIEKNKT